METELTDIMKELIKKLLIDNLEIRLEQGPERHTIRVSLVLFDEVISSDFMYL